MANAKFRVRAVNQAGEVLFSGTKTTLKNGFFEIWLPRGQSITLSVEKGRLVSERRLTTYDGAKTCLTDFRLS
ncbi:MAG: CueP family metal-binding protein [Desulfohalobiaceae bacterium]|nr:CueP family metal-binding protein [Desulfohalobiaceae bacterium]